MPLYLDPEPREPVLRTRDVCDWQVLPIVRGRVALTTAVALHTPAFAVTFTAANLPQLRKVIELLERDQ